MHTLLVAALLSGAAFAQETIDVGVLKQGDISVVQNLLYPKKDKNELGVHAGVMPFDRYTLTPVGSLSYTHHYSEALGADVSLSGGYGLKNSAYRELEGPEYNVAPDAYRFLGSVMGHIHYAPIYAKMSILGGRVVHHDVYGLLGAGLTVEQAILPDNTLAFSPTIGAAIGMRVFLKEDTAIRIQLRDDVILQQRTKTVDTQSWFVKQNLAVTVGYVLFRK
ncbi:MAG: outer membrane beta-barrel domain-containing protein [Myxococcota bacterium]